jgi:hypothetical protein
MAAPDREGTAAGRHFHRGMVIDFLPQEAVKLL